MDQHTRNAQLDCAHRVQPDPVEVRVVHDVQIVNLRRFTVVLPAQQVGWHRLLASFSWPESAFWPFEADLPEILAPFAHCLLLCWRRWTNIDVESGRIHQCAEEECEGEKEGQNLHFFK